MNVTRFATAPAYPVPPDHHALRCLRLQGHNAGPASSLWLGLSILEPGGHIDRSASPLEKHYVVLAGEVTMLTDDGEAVLSPWDSVRLAPGEARAVENRSGKPATLLLCMPLTT